MDLKSKSFDTSKLYFFYVFTLNKYWRFMYAKTSGKIQCQNNPGKIR